jgi:hypothetical protein
MSLISRLERRFGRFAIPNITLLIIMGQVALYVADLLPQGGVSLEGVELNPAKIADGQYWRLVTFLVAPPGRDPLVIFYFLLLFRFGTALELYWGTFRYNVYLLIGYVANVAAAFAASAIAGSALHAGNGAGVELASAYASNGFLYSSIFLAFARLSPDTILNLMFVLPIRVRWLALGMWIFYAYQLVRGDMMTRMLVLATVLNYLIFFWREHWREFRHGHRRRSFQAKAKKATTAPRHECRVCGANSIDSPKTLFRYCSKCDGQVCYCPDHIRDHEHVTATTPAAP